MIIREAVKGDVGDVLRMAEWFVEHTPFVRRFGSADGVGKTLSWLLYHEAGVVLVAELGGDRGGSGPRRLVGLLAVVVSPNLLSGELGGSEVMWCVPDGAGPRVAIRLLRAGEQWARNHGATTFQVGGWNDRLCRFYQRIGYEPTERMFVRRLEEK